MTIDEALENRHKVFVIYDTPWPYLTADGKEEHAHMEYRTTVHEAIGIQRYINTDVYMKQNREPIGMSDKELLMDYVVVNWARFE